MAKLDWTRVGQTIIDPGTITELRDYEPPPRQPLLQRERLTSTDAAALLERSEAIRLKAVAKKKEILAAGGKWTGTKKDRQMITAGKKKKRKS